MAAEASASSRRRPIVSMRRSTRTSSLFFFSPSAERFPSVVFTSWFLGFFSIWLGFAAPSTTRRRDSVDSWRGAGRFVSLSVSFLFSTRRTPPSVEWWGFDFLFFCLFLRRSTELAASFSQLSAPMGPLMDCLLPRLAPSPPLPSSRWKSGTASLTETCAAFQVRLTEF